MPDLVCPSCSCLCDDIRIYTEGTKLTRVENACLKGASFIRAVAEQGERTCLVEGKPASLEAAVEAAARILSASRHPLIFGLDNSTTEAQAQAIALARALGAVLDDTSSFCQGGLTELILRGRVPTCPLSQASTLADLLVYWGANPYQAHPRHLSRYTFYPRAQYREAGWTPDVVLAGVDIRETETSIICHHFFRLPPGGDREFLAQVLAGLAGREVDKLAAEFVRMVEAAHFPVFFIGLGLVYSLGNDLAPVETLLERIARQAKVAAIPMVGHFNTRGFNYTLFRETGYINRVSFINGTAHGDEFSFLEQLRQERADAVLVVGSDPLTALPRSAVRRLLEVPLICLDPFPTATFQAARVSIAVAPSALEVSGTARRMDGEAVSLPRAFPPRSPSDEEVLARLAERLGR